jgi:hypothetical protein
MKTLWKGRTRYNPVVRQGRNKNATDEFTLLNELGILHGVF